MYSDAAMIMFYDVAPGTAADHDDWHTHEHMPERLSIPGFLRGSRCVAEGEGPRYMMMYEVAGVDVLTGPDYAARLNNPTPWTSRVMTSLRGMQRGFFRLTASAGVGRGDAILAIRCAGRQDELRGWLASMLPGIASRPGIASACLFEPAAKPGMTKEQSIRGKDTEATPVLLVTGYEREPLAAAARNELGPDRFRQHGAEPLHAAYRLAYSLSARELQGNG